MTATNLRASHPSACTTPMCWRYSQSAHRTRQTNNFQGCQGFQSRNTWPPAKYPNREAALLENAPSNNWLPRPASVFRTASTLQGTDAIFQARQASALLNEAQVLTRLTY